MSNPGRLGCWCSREADGEQFWGCLRIFRNNPHVAFSLGRGSLEEKMAPLPRPSERRRRPPTWPWASSLRRASWPSWWSCSWEEFRRGGPRFFLLVFLWLPGCCSSVCLPLFRNRSWLLAQSPKAELPTNQGGEALEILGSRGGSKELPVNCCKLLATLRQAVNPMTALVLSRMHFFSGDVGGQTRLTLPPGKVSQGQARACLSTVLFSWCPSCRRQKRNQAQ